MPSESPWPLMPAKSTELRLSHFDEYVYTADSSTVLYKLMDAMCGDAGAGSLKKQIFLQRLSGAIDGIYGSDLDYIFGNTAFLSRAPSESYTYDTMVQMLTSDQWDEVEVKDSWYRARITEYFKACALGGTIDGIRAVVHAACSVECDVMESWRYADNFGLGDNIGRGPVTNRNEFTVVPYKTEIPPKESRLLRDMLDKITPQDSVATINPEGLSVYSPVPIRSIVADSVYFEIQKVVTPGPALEDIPEPEILAIDLDPTEKWLFSRTPELAPYAKFNITQEYSYYYLIGGGQRSPIDSVTYGIMREDGKVVPEQDFQLYETTGQYAAWREYEKADSPDNYPGGKFGLTPATTPAVNPDGTPYQFSYTSQQDYIDQKKAEVLGMDGFADEARYRLPIEKSSYAIRTFTPDLAIAYSAPARDSTVTSSWTSRKPRQSTGELRDPNSFVRG